MQVSSIKSHMDFLTNIGFDIRSNVYHNYVYKIGTASTSLEEINIENAVSPEEFYSSINNNQATGYITLFIIVENTTESSLSLYTHYYGVKEVKDTINE